MKPYKCPICDGRTVVEKGYYPDEPKRTKCRACIQGVVYGADSQPTTIPVPYPVPQPYPVPEPYPVPVYPRPYRPYLPWRVDPWWDPPYRVWCGTNKTANTSIALGGSVGGVYDVSYSIAPSSAAND